MLPRRARLTRGRLTLIMKKGARAHGRLFTCIFLRGTAPGASVVVSKKVAKTSVLRNRIRRRAYSALRNMTLPSSLVLVAKDGAATASLEALRADIAQILARAV